MSEFTLYKFTDWQIHSLRGYFKRVDSIEKLGVEMTDKGPIIWGEFKLNGSIEVFKIEREMPDPLG